VRGTCGPYRAVGTVRVAHVGLWGLGHTGGKVVNKDND
jgi:hypothetical protein